MLPLQWCLPHSCQPRIQDADKDIEQRELSLNLSWRYPGASHACTRSFIRDRVLVRMIGVTSEGDSSAGCVVAIRQ